MKKTIHTLLTAAMFAAANMAAMPAVAEDGNSLTPNLEPVESLSFGDTNTNNDNSDDISAEGVGKNILKATTKSMATVYGPPPTTTVNTTALIDESLTSTTTSLPEWLMTTPTTTVEILYGPTVPYNRLGDVNEDNNVDIFDLVALRKLLVSGQSRSFYSDNYADVNFDRKVNIADLVRLQQFLLGKIDSLNDGNWDFMRSKTIETVSANNEQDIETTTTTTYKPGRVTTVTLYGIMPARSVNAQYIDPDETTYTTAEEITPEEK